MSSPSSSSSSSASTFTRPSPIYTGKPSETPSDDEDDLQLDAFVSSLHAPLPPPLPSPSLASRVPSNLPSSPPPPTGEGGSGSNSGGGGGGGGIGGSVVGSSASGGDTARLTNSGSAVRASSNLGRSTKTLVSLPTRATSAADLTPYFNGSLVRPFTSLLKGYPSDKVDAAVLEISGLVAQAYVDFSLESPKVVALRCTDAIERTLQHVLGVSESKAQKVTVFCLPDLYTSITAAVEALHSLGDRHSMPAITEGASSGGSGGGSTSAAEDIDFEDIEVFELIGEGALGSVHRGRLWGLDVAVKTLKAELVTEVVLSELKNEIKILKGLRHPNIVLYIAACTTLPKVAVVTEFLEGGCVFDYIHNPNTIIDIREVISIAHSVALGINYLHEQSPPILHRDLKSLNLLTSESGVCKVCDFGLSWQGAATGRAGTAQWMAPEIVADEPYNEKVDVYSFGVILVELVTRQMPFSDRYAGMDFVPAVLRGEKPSIPPARVSGPLAPLIEACLSHDPAARPPFSALVGDLRKIRSLPTLDDVDLHRLMWWLDSTEEHLHLCATTHIANMDGALAVSSQSHLMRRLVSFLWRADGVLLQRVVQSVGNLARTEEVLALFTTMDGLPLLMSRITVEDNEVKKTVLDAIAQMVTTGHEGTCAQAREALMGLGMLKHLFKLQDQFTSAQVILHVLSMSVHAGGASLSSLPSSPSTEKHRSEKAPAFVTHTSAAAEMGGGKALVSRSAKRRTVSHVDTQRLSVFSTIIEQIVTECNQLQDGPQDAKDIAAVELTSVLARLRSLVGSASGPTPGSPTILNKVTNHHRSRSRSMSGPSSQ